MTEGNFSSAKDGVGLARTIMGDLVEMHRHSGV
jgi:hypothetical protein